MLANPLPPTDPPLQKPIATRGHLRITFGEDHDADLDVERTPSRNPGFPGCRAEGTNGRLLSST